MNPDEYKILGVIQQRVYKTRVNNMYELNHRLLVWMYGVVCSTVLSTLLSPSEERKHLQACDLDTYIKQ